MRSVEFMAGIALAGFALGWFLSGWFLSACVNESRHIGPVYRVFACVPAELAGDTPDYAFSPTGGYIHIDYKPREENR